MAGAKPATVKGLKDKPCIKVNASQDTGPYSLFDIPADMIEAEFIMAVRKARPKWQIYSEHGEQPCEANVFADLKGLSVSLDRVESSNSRKLTSGVSGALSVYIPGALEQPTVNVAIGESVPAVAKLLVSGLEQDVRAARSPERPQSNAKQPVEGKFCYSVDALNRKAYENLAQNFFYASGNTVFSSPRGYEPSENCIPDFYVSTNDTEIRSPDGIEGVLNVLVLRMPGETRSRIYIASGQFPGSALVSNLQDMGRVLTSLEKTVATRKAQTKDWSEVEIEGLLETLATSRSYIRERLSISQQNRAKKDELFRAGKRQEALQMQQKIEQEHQHYMSVRRDASEALIMLRAALMADETKVRNVAERYVRSKDADTRDLIQNILQKYNGLQRERGRSNYNSEFVLQAAEVWNTID